MNSSTTKRFRSCLQRLPPQVQRQAREAYKRFLDNPSHPGLRFKRTVDKMRVFLAAVVNRLSLLVQSSKPAAAVGPAVLLAVLAWGVGGCEREPGSSEAVPAGGGLPESTLIDFPPDVQVDDPSVNAFAREIIETCAGGDYERFRLLWTVKEEPFPRGQFERAWKALKKVRVLALQKMKTLEGEYLYYLHVRVLLDKSVPEPDREREFVLMVVKENDRWRLASAPSHLRRKVLGEKAEDSENGDGRASSRSTTEPAPARSSTLPPA